MTKIFKLAFLGLLFIGVVLGQADDSDILSGEQHQTIHTANTTESKPTISQPLISTTPPPVRRQFKLDVQTLSLYRYEAFAVLCIFLYLVLYRRGKAQNVQIMENFYNKIRGYVDQNFSHIGFTKNSGQDPFVAESPSQAMFYASGRENVEYLEIKFNMLKRQDLIYHLIYQTIYPEKDTITIDIPVKTNHPVVFCIANHKKVRHITQRNLDIAKLAGTFQAKGLNPSYHVLAEAAETVDSILDPNIIKKLNQVFPLVYSIHYTDQKSFSESEGHLRATLFASDKNSDKYLAALQLLFQIVDRIYNMKISANYKAKAFKARQAFNASVQKQKLQKHKDQLRKKKQQKRKQEEAWLRSLPPEKQKREDQKRKKKEINKLLKSRVMKAA